MRTILLLMWLLIPVLIGAYHYGPGQDRMRTDHVARLLRQADQWAADEKWTEAKQNYNEALRLLSEDKIHESRAIRLNRAKVQMECSELPEAHAELNVLVDEMQSDPQADRSLLSEARATLANAQYYMTWLMRLEGQPRELWEPEIEASRQTFRYLAEQAQSRSDAMVAQSNREDLESAIRLARMDLRDLQGLPLPSQ